MSMRAAGRLAGHDIKTIHGDVQALSCKPACLRKTKPGG